MAKLTEEEMQIRKFEREQARKEKEDRGELNYITKTLKNGNTLYLIDCSGSGGGNFYSPQYLRVVEVSANTKYTKVNAKNVIKHYDSFEYNKFAGKGKKSLYAQQYKKAKELFESIN